jgi:hypothetical protein
MEDIAVKALSGLQKYLEDSEKEEWRRFDLPDVTGFERRGPYIVLEEQKTGDYRSYGKLFDEMLARGVLLPPDPYEPLIIPAEYTEGEAGPLLRELRRRYADR